MRRPLENLIQMIRSSGIGYENAVDMFLDSNNTDSLRLTNLELLTLLNDN